MNDLRINLLGPPEILWEGQLISVKRRIPRTLLYYLASNKNKVGRGTLLTLFWEDSPKTFARRRLREALSRIRAEIPDPSILIIHSDLVGLDGNKISVDQRKFQELLAKIGNKPWNLPEHEILPYKTFQDMIHATDLWRGPQFLAGSDLPSSSQMEDWWQQTNQKLVQMRIRLLIRLSDHYRAIGQLDDAINCAYQALESNNLNEDLHLRVLRLLADMQLHQEARQYYSYVTELLIKELDSYPSQQLVSIYRQIQSESTPKIDPSQPNWRILVSLQTPFVGRQEEFKRLNNALHSGGGVIVSGESGLGKTRFVQEFCELYANDRRILVSPARQAEIILPYQPIIDLLRNNIQAAEWKELPAIWAESLAALLPELLSVHPTISPPGSSLNPEQFRSTLLEAIRQIFVLTADKNDLIIFVDDAQWADEASLSTLAYLTERSPFTKNALIILSMRTDDISPSSAGFIKIFADPINSRLIELPRLSFSEISSLGRYVLGYPLSLELTRMLEHDTGGNPFFILETLRTVQETETRSAFSNQASLPLADSVHTLIQNRIDRLSPLARETIEFAAVIGTEFDPELISMANQQDITIVSRAIEELKQRHLVDTVSHPYQELCCRFIHDKIRETILLEINSVRLRFLHENVARAMEQQFNGQPRNQSAVLAQHFESAGKLSDAIQYWLKAGQWARRLYRAAEAYQIFAHGEELISLSDANLDDQLIRDMYAEWTELSFELGDGNSIRHQNKNLLDLGRDRNSLLLIGTAYDGFSDACMVENRFSEGLEYTNQAINYLNQTDHVSEKMDSQIHRGVFLYMLGNIDEAIQSFELALAHVDEDRDPQVQRAKANAHYQLALSLTFSGWPELGLNHARLSLELANRIKHHHIAVTAHTASSFAYYYLADFQKARQENQQGIEIAERIQAVRMLGYLYAIHGFLDNAEGDFSASYRSAQKIVEIGEQHNYPDLLSISSRVIGDTFLLLEKPGTACEHFQKGVDLGSKDFWGLDNLIRLGYAQIRKKQTEMGMANLLRGIESAKKGGLGITEIQGNQFLCYAYIFMQDWERARQVARKLERQARKRSMLLIQVLSQVTQAIADARLGNSEISLDQLQFCADSLAEIGYPNVEVRTLLQLTKLKQSIGQNTDIHIHRIEEILQKFAQNDQPKEIHQAAINFNKVILEQLEA
jgi:predicted ATPase